MRGSEQLKIRVIPVLIARSDATRFPATVLREKRGAWRCLSDRRASLVDQTFRQGHSRCMDGFDAILPLGAMRDAKLGG